MKAIKSILKNSRIIRLVTLSTIFCTGNMLSKGITSDQKKAIAQKIISQKQVISTQNSNMTSEQPKTPAQTIIAETEKAFKTHNYYRIHPEKGRFSDYQKFEHLDYDKHFDILLEYFKDILPKRTNLRDKRDDLQSKISALAWETQSWMQWLKGEETEELKNLKSDLSSIKKQLNQIDRECFYAKEALEYMFLQKYNRRLEHNEIYGLIGEKYHKKTN